MDNDIIKSVKADSSALKGDVNKIEEAIKKLLEQQKKLEESGKINGKRYQTLASDIRIAKQALEETEKKIDLNSKALKLNSGSLQQNQALLESLKNQQAKVAAAKGDDATQVQKLDKLIKELNSTISDQEEKLVKSAESFDFKAESVNKVKEALGELKDHGSKFGPEFASTLESSAKGFKAMQDGIKVVQTGFKGIGGAIKTSGFGLLVLILESVVEYFTKTKEGSDLLRQLLAGLGVVVKTIEGGFNNFKKTLGEVFVHPVEGIKKLGRLIEENIMNRVRAIYVIYEGILNKDFKKVANGFLQLGTGVKDVYTKAEQAFIKAGKEETKTDKGSKTVHHNRTVRHEQHKQQLKEATDLTKQAEEERLASVARMVKSTLEGYAKEIDDANVHFTEMKSVYTRFLNDYEKMSGKQKAAHLKEHKAVTAAVEQLEKEHQARLSSITKKFQDEDAKKLDGYHKTLNQISKTARQEAQTHLDEDYKRQAQEIQKIKDDSDALMFDTSQKLEDLKRQPETEASKALITELTKRQTEAQSIFDHSVDLLNRKYSSDTKTLNLDFNQKKKQEDETQAESKIQGEISVSREGGHESAAIKKEIALLKMQHDFAVKAAQERGEATTQIDAKFAKQKADLENKLISSKIHAGDKYIEAVLKNTKKDSAIYKAAFLAKKATAIADVVMSTKTAIIESFKGYAGMPFIGQALAIAQGAFIATQGAMSVAEIVKQKPGFAKGGQYVSDGRGAILPGYSRTDNTNAYLRSGEAVVVSEAMRNPWARNLVSAINVAHGGRDFSMSNPGRGYAIGGIFTDGGNANRYYSAPVNDQKDLANTLAYQMINNFPPIYVDVKDVNNQQNILAKTVDRVNL
jgi:hypothetical protein